MQKPYLNDTKMAKSETLFLIKTTEKLLSQITLWKGNAFVKSLLSLISNALIMKQTAIDSMPVLYSAINHVLFGRFPWSTDNSPILTKIA